MDGFDPKDIEELADRFTAIMLEHLRLCNDALREYVADMREREYDDQVRRLVERFPELGEEAVARDVVREAFEYADGVGVPKVASEPMFWGLIYLSRFGRPPRA